MSSKQEKSGDSGKESESELIVEKKPPSRKQPTAPPSSKPRQSFAEFRKSLGKKKSDQSIDSGEDEILVIDKPKSRSGSFTSDRGKEDKRSSGEVERESKPDKIEAIDPSAKESSKTPASTSVSATDSRSSAQSKSTEPEKSEGSGAKSNPSEEKPAPKANDVPGEEKQSDPSNKSNDSTGKSESKNETSSPRESAKSEVEQQKEKNEIVADKVEQELQKSKITENAEKGEKETGKPKSKKEGSQRPSFKEFLQGKRRGSKPKEEEEEVVVVSKEKPGQSGKGIATGEETAKDKSSTAEVLPNDPESSLMESKKENDPKEIPSTNDKVNPTPEVKRDPKPAAEKVSSSKNSGKEANIEDPLEEEKDQEKARTQEKEREKEKLKSSSVAEKEKSKKVETAAEPMQEKPKQEKELVEKAEIERKETMSKNDNPTRKDNGSGDKEKEKKEQGALATLKNFFSGIGKKKEKVKKDDSKKSGIEGKESKESKKNTDAAGGPDHSKPLAVSDTSPTTKQPVDSSRIHTLQNPPVTSTPLGVNDSTEDQKWDREEKDGREGEPNPVPSATTAGNVVSEIPSQETEEMSQPRENKSEVPKQEKRSYFQNMFDNLSLSNVIGKRPIHPSKTNNPETIRQSTGTKNRKTTAVEHATVIQSAWRGK